MKLSETMKLELDRRFQKVLATPASFDFLMAIHDFVQYIELSSLSKRLPIQYAHLKQIYQGVKDSGAKSKGDLGHARYMVIHDLNRIQNNEFSQNNLFWRKQEFFRKLAIEIHEKLNPSF
ncbi:MAG: hypothetical protein UV75_C0006G0041 [Candidatus Giovannonibacteria bacterium GW2011_GWA1_43_15]|nr:MAG: hypothetical protein UV75_C0006G0041 [Candidatus Giovannonibacteria bacterium GW2011_GWA1_43_15]